METVYWCMVVGLFSLSIGLWLGQDVMISRLENNIEHLGGFYIDDNVYECKIKEGK